MQHKFRTQSISAELELVAKEFDNALPAQKNDKAEYLLLFMEDYPNADLKRALPIIEKNFLDKSLGNGVRRKCARMLGGIGESCIEQKTTSHILGLLLAGMEDYNPYMVCECMDAIGKMADARRWHEFDEAIRPLLERVANARDPVSDPNVLRKALNTLEKIKPNDPYCMVIAKGAQRGMEAKRNSEMMKHPDSGADTDWDGPIRKIIKIREGWRSHLERKGVLEKEKIELPKPPANSVSGNAPGSGKAPVSARRRTITP